MIDALRPKLARVGVRLPADRHRNVMGFWPVSGTRADEQPILLCAHTDPVRPTPDMQPVIRDGVVHTDGSSVLGADDKAAVAAIVDAVEAIASAGTPHPPVEVLFTVGEDIGHIGFKAFDVADVRSRMAFVPDIDGPVGGTVMASPWAKPFADARRTPGRSPKRGAARCRWPRARSTGCGSAGSTARPPPTPECSTAGKKPTSSRRRPP